MDLMINTTAITSNVKHDKKKKGSDPGGGFSMNFTKSQPIKALVARKRVPSTKAVSLPKPSSTAFKFENPKSDLMLANIFIGDSTDQDKSKSGKTPSSKGSFKKNPAKPMKKNTNTVTAKKTENNKKSLPTVVEFPDDASDAQPRNTKKGNAHKSTNKIYKNKKTIIKSNLFDHDKMPKVEEIEVNPLGEKVFSGVLLESLDIHAHSKKNIIDILKFKQLTVVQNLAIPKIMMGRDVLIRSQTGSGKTLAYALPLVEHLHTVQPRTTRKDGIFAVVIVPTRELALQTYELFLKLLKPFTWIVAGYLCGGESRKSEKARLRAGINILIGTPGRFCDHLLHTESLKLNAVKYLALDEADRLLELGYEKDVTKIVDSINANQKERVQTILLSATLSASVKELAGLTLKDPAFIDTSDISVSHSFDNINIDSLEDKIIIPSAITQSYLIVPPKLRLVTLSAIIANECSQQSHKVLVFLATQSLVDYHYDVMVEVLTQKIIDSEDEEDDEVSENEDEKEGEATVLLPRVRFFKLHGKMTQIERNSVFKEFRAVKTGVLLCTDVAGRGIDVPEVDAVIQFNPPQILSDYVHRVGRTARAGQKGRAIIILGPNEDKFIQTLRQNKIRIKADNIETVLKSLIPVFGGNHKTSEYAAIELQHRFEKLVTDENIIFARACKAFVSWIRFYSNFPKDLKAVFSLKEAHMGHYAKSLGLREPPKNFIRQHTAPTDDQPQNRLTEDERKSKPFVQLGRSQMQLNKRNQNRLGTKRTASDFARGLKTSKMLNISEFDSGMPAKKKKKN